MSLPLFSESQVDQVMSAADVASMESQPSTQRKRRRASTRGSAYLPSTAKDASQDARIRSLQRQVRRQALALRPELKYDGVANLTTPVTDNGTVVDICSPPQGNADNNRTGDKIKIVGVHLRAHLAGDPTLPTACTATVMLVQDKQGSLTTATISELLLGTDLGGALAPHARPNFDMVPENHKILWRDTFSLEGGALNTHVINKFLKLKMAETVFDAGSTTILRNGLKLVYVSDRASGLQAPAIVYTVRAFFTDN